jgi:hypothetical protein
VSATCSSSLLPGSSLAICRWAVLATCSSSLLAGSWRLFLLLAASFMRHNALKSPWGLISLWIMNYGG